MANAELSTNEPQGEALSDINSALISLFDEYAEISRHNPAELLVIDMYDPHRDLPYMDRKKIVPYGEIASQKLEELKKFVSHAIKQGTLLMNPALIPQDRGENRGISIDEIIQLHVDQAIMNAQSRLADSLPQPAHISTVEVDDASIKSFRDVIKDLAKGALEVVGTSVHQSGEIVLPPSRETRQVPVQHMDEMAKPSLRRKPLES